MATFGQRLKELRLQKDMTQEELATRIGIGKQAVSQYESDKRHPDFETLGAFSDFFNVSADYMIGKSDITLRLLTSSDIERLERGEVVSTLDSKLLKAFHSASPILQKGICDMLGIEYEENNKRDLTG